MGRQLNSGLKIAKAREFVLANPTIKGNRTMARILWAENQRTYKDIEDARDYIRRALGRKGNDEYRKVAIRLGINEQREKLAAQFGLPEESHNDFSPYEMKVKKGDRIIILSDIHFPYQHNAALIEALQYTKKSKPTHILLNGDIMDCHQISHFLKDPEKKNFDEEIDIVITFLERLRKTFPKTPIIYKIGNHEERYYKYLLQNPQLHKIKKFSFENLMGLSAMKIDLVDNKRVIRIGKLNAVHGHEFGHQIFSPVNPARGLFLRGKTNTIAGHHHVTSSHGEKTLDDKQIATYSMGCLCDLKPEYRPINSWNHGFARVDILNNEGVFMVTNLRILDGKVIGG